MTTELLVPESDKAANLTFRVSVRGLVETMLRSGDINFRFSSRRSALDGLRGHQNVQRQRPENYRSEVSITGDYIRAGLRLQLTGRMDGVYEDDPPVIEEIKTHSLPLEDLPKSQTVQHRAQALVYAWLYARANECAEIGIRLTWFDLETETITSADERLTREELDVYCNDLAGRYLDWMSKLHAWQRLRDLSIEQLIFPHESYREGQRTLAVSAYRIMTTGGRRFVEAPTGIGKTMGTLFPAIKALGNHQHDRVFYLTAKTIGREVAEQSIGAMSKTGLQIRSLTLTAKDKICFTPGAPCDPAYCSYARGYYDKLDDVLACALSTKNRFNRLDIEDISREHHLCPFELSLDLSLWVDVIICDYNYVFDPSVYLRRFFDEPWGINCFLIDEAHNLVDRGRSMYSADLYKSDVLAVRRLLKKLQLTGSSVLIRKLDAINRVYLKLKKAGLEELLVRDHLIYDRPPQELLSKVRALCDVAEQWLAEHQEGAGHEELLQIYFDSLRLLRAGEWFDDCFVCLLVKGRKNDLRFWLYCLDPSRMIAESLERSKSSLMFSATLAPLDYYTRLLGVEPGAHHLQLPSPFPQDHLGLYVVRNIATSFKGRQHSYQQVVDVIEDVVNAKMGNYLIYFPSYQYLEQVCDLYMARDMARECSVRTQRQVRDMSEESRLDFLKAFAEDPDESLVSFAVMGGIFGEGIDLKGSRLIGVVVIGVGLPQMGLERNLIRDHFSSLEDSSPDNKQGFAYAYQYPGMNRVLQTAGRVIRSEQDRGIVCLIDERFAWRDYRRLFPQHWQPRLIDGQGVSDAVARFWQSLDA